MIKRVLLSVLLVLGLAVHANGAFVLNEQDGSHVSGFAVSVLEDKNHSYTIHDILSSEVAARFEVVDSRTLDYGFTDSTYWIKITVLNPYNHKFDWFLEVAYPMLDIVELFFNSKNGIESRLTGDLLPFTHRGNRYRNFLFSLHSKPRSQGDYFLRVRSSSSMNIPLNIGSMEEIKNKIDGEQLAYGLFFGAMAIMIIYNLLLFLSLRHPTYLYYVIFMSVSTLFLFTLYGLSFKYLWPDYVWWANNCMPFLIFLCNIFCVTFVRSFLSTQKEQPLFDRFLVAYVFLNLCLLTVSLLLDYRVVIKIATFMAVFAAILPLVASVRLFNRSRQARLYLLAWSALFFGIIVYGLKSYGILPRTPLTEYAMVIGLILEIILLSFGIADRINTIKNERMAAQRLQILTQRRAYKEQKLLTVSFERFVPKRFLNLLGRQSIKDVRVGDHVERRMSVLFSDIRQFTKMSERMSPEEIFTFLNRYLRKMEPIIKGHHGVVDKYIGDAIMAIFDDANDAFQAGLSLLRGVDEYNDDRAKDGLLPIDIGIGINTGDLMLGTIGVIERMEGTVIGQAVNIASRMESLTKEYKTSLLISDDTYQELKDSGDYHMRVIDKVAVKGTTDPITIWEVFPNLV